jgi:hypothetical protein
MNFNMALAVLFHVTRMVEKRNAYRVLVGKPEGKRPLGRHSRVWENNIKIDLTDTGWENLDCISLTQGRYN